MLEAIRALEAWGARRGWAGSDPYDGLNTTRLLTPLKRHSRGRQALIQLVKRSPLDLRPLLGIRPAPNAAALAWVLSAYAQTDFLDPAEQAQRRRDVLGVLLALRSPGWDEPCWGYHFDMQSRVFFYPKTDPNAIATCYVGMALLDVVERDGPDPELLELAEGIGRFLVANVPQTPDPPGAFFGYLVGDRSPIHNSNLHVAALLARLSTHVDQPEWRAAAEEGVRWTVSRQRPDGSWPYGERPNLSWVDGFHSGYVLDSLLVCAEAGLDDGIEEAWRRGLAFWREHLFLDDGTPRYYSHSTHPIDAQCAAQGLQTLALAAARDPSCLAQAADVFDYTQRAMRRPDGAYVFQRRRRWVNRVPHVRGANAETFLGLARLLRAQRAVSAPAG